MLSKQDTRQCTLTALDSTNYSLLMFFPCSILCENQIIIFFSNFAFNAYIVNSCRRRVVNKNMLIVTNCSALKYI